MDLISISAYVETYMNKINYYINELDKQGVLHMENIIEYKYKDLFDLKKIIKVCPRCNKQFVPNYGCRNTQIYCGDDCRYNSTQDTRKELKRDRRYDKIDNLRKLIYERKYRVRRDSKQINKDELDNYEIILLECKSLVKDRKKIPYYEFNKRYETLIQLYRTTGHW